MSDRQTDRQTDSLYFSTIKIKALQLVNMTYDLTTNSVNMTYARHKSPSSSVVRASDRCTEGHGFDSRRGLRFFLCPTLATC